MEGPISNVTSLNVGEKYVEVQHTRLQISGADFWQNRVFNDKSVKTSKNVPFDLLNKIGYGPIT